MTKLTIEFEIQVGEIIFLNVKTLLQRKDSYSNNSAVFRFIRNVRRPSENLRK